MPTIVCPKGYNECPRCGEPKSFNSPQCLKCRMKSKRDALNQRGKPCTKCKEYLPMENFPPNTQRIDGKHTWCSACCYKTKKEYREKHKEKHRERMKVYYEHNKEKAKQHGLAFRMKKFGVSLQWYFKTLAEQGGVCAICGDHPKGSRMMPIDHNHSCCPDKTACDKCRRAILCERCNWALGVMENVELFEKLQSYLAKYPLKSDL